MPNTFSHLNQLQANVLITYIFLTVMNNFTRDKIYILLSSGFLSGDTWIGLRDNGRGKNWHWTDGSSLSYKNWSPGNPNNFNGNQHCGQVRDLLHTSKLYPPLAGLSELKDVILF